MKLSPGKAAEYTRRHNPVWPEMAAALKAGGVHNYSIFHLPSTGQLFAYLEIEDHARWAAVGRADVGQRWRKHMSELLETNPDLSPVSDTLTEVFHLD